MVNPTVAVLKLERRGGSSDKIHHDALLRDSRKTNVEGGLAGKRRTAYFNV
ncbi:MAG TPA: hypothetical protein VIU29_10695 [Candidatus Deferrimicrobiaceae bacterium]